MTEKVTTSWQDAFYGAMKDVPRIAVLSILFGVPAVLIDDWIDSKSADNVDYTQAGRTYRIEHPSKLVIGPDIVGVVVNSSSTGH